MITVLLAEDQVMVREPLANLLSLEGDIEVVSQVGRGDQVTAAALATRPDVAPLDIEMPGLDGLAAAAALSRELPACRTLILTTFSRPGHLRRAMDAGVWAFLIKAAPAAELARSIRRAMAGERVIDAGLAIAALTERDTPLTAREQEVILACRNQPTVADIAAAVHLSPGTVRNHLSAAMTKLGAHNRAEALRIAQDKGWV